MFKFQKCVFIKCKHQNRAENSDYTSELDGFSKFRTRPIILILLMNSILSRVMLFPYYLPNIHVKPLGNDISNLIRATHSSHVILLLYL